MIHDMFVFYDFEIFSNFQKWPKFRLLRVNCSRKCKIKIFSGHFKSDLDYFKSDLEYGTKKIQRRATEIVDHMVP